MRRFAVLLAIVSCALAARADTVTMKGTELKLEGKIQRETKDFIILLLHGDNGQIRIPKDKILKIEYDIKTQLDQLPEDDYAGRYKVALWAIDKGMLAEAIDLFEELKGKEGVGPDMLKLLAQCYDKRGQLDKALKSYTDYLAAHQDDEAVKARVEELKKVINPEGSAEQPQIAKAEEGLEKDGVWTVEHWEDANPAVLQPTTEQTTGNKVISVKGEGGQKSKTAFSRTGDPLNLSDSKDMVFRAYLNSATPVSMAVAFNNAKGEFFESKQTRVAPNSWVKVTLPVDSKDFKAQKNDWKYALPLEGKERVGRIYFLVYGQREFTMYVDGVFFTKQPQQ